MRVGYKGQTKTQLPEQQFVQKMHKRGTESAAKRSVPCAQQGWWCGTDCTHSRRLSNYLGTSGTGSDLAPEAGFLSSGLLLRLW